METNDNVRLQIASRILAGFVANPKLVEEDASEVFWQTDKFELIKEAIDLADRIIIAEAKR